mmetsp:Transcript_7834/g.18900  ORF Transcript_7834/g.18900 Transcript_7834/m.18900 type:complete len:136 (-) Transcript_7834:718-1125(-)|eukprot:g11907.t1
MESQLESGGKLPSSRVVPELDMAPAGLRSQILQLEELVDAEIKTARARIQELQETGGEPVSEELVRKSLDKMKNAVQEAHNKTDAELKDYYESLTQRNAATQKDISDVKVENAQLQQALVGLQRRLKMLEVALGD